MAKFKEGYIVKVDEEIGKIFRVNENTCVVQFSDRRKVVRMESIEILDATENADIRTYKMYETKKCTECGITKPQFEFSKMRGNKLRNQCKECFGRMISDGHREKKAIRERAKVLKESKQVAKPEQKPVVEPIKPIKNIEEWVEKNLNKETNKPETELSNLEKMAQEYETKANYYQELATMAKEIVESCRSLDLKLKEREAIHE